MPTEFDTIRPICVAPPVVTADGLVFMHPEAPLTVNEHTKELWTLLAECDGRRSVAEIAVAVDLPSKTVKTLLYDLYAAGILIDCNSLADHFHNIASNRSLYLSGLTHEESIAYSQKISMGKKRGTLRTPGKILGTKVGQLSQARASCRSFAEKSITKEQLTTLLVNTYSFQVYPIASSGGLYPLRIYVVLIKQVGDLQPGYYQFLPSNHKFVAMPIAFDPVQIAYAFDTENLFYGAAACILLAGDLTVQALKSGNRGYGLTLIEVGEAVQNICLTATELKLGSLVYTNFEDRVVNKLMGLAPREFVLAGVAVGHKSDKPMQDYIIFHDKLHQQFVGPDRPLELLMPTSSTDYSDDLRLRAAVAVFHPGQAQHLSREERVSVGAGTSSALASVKAMAEGVERWAGMQPHVSVEATAHQMRGRWLDPRQVAPYSDEQYKALDVAPFDPDATFQWARGRELASGKQVHVPIDLVYYGLSAATLGRKLCALSSSSGVAAYSSLEEATRRAVLELIERDAIMRSWLCKAAPNRLRPQALPAVYRRRVAYWHSRGRKVEVLNLSNHHTAIIGVLIHGPDYPCLVSGYAASDRDVEEAIAKAFQEAELSLTAALSEPPLKAIHPKDVWMCQDHAVLYYYPAHISHAEWMWRGPYADFRTNLQPISRQYKALDIVAVDLSRQTKPLLYVVRALSTKLVPVSFGVGTEHYTHHTLRGKINPSVRKIPHFYA